MIIGKRRMRLKARPRSDKLQAREANVAQEKREAQEAGEAERQATAEEVFKAVVLRQAFEKLLARPEIEGLLEGQGVQVGVVGQAIEQILAEVVSEQALTQTAAQQQLLRRINQNAAGLDISSKDVWANVPEGRDEKTVRRFEMFTPDLNKLADWLEACKIDTVAMESTGVYWIPIYEILEARGIEVYLVNARHIKNVSGRKTDVIDCQWIQALHTYGLLQASFRPSENHCALRAYVRQRSNLIRYRASHIQHMQKALVQMNVLLTNVVKDITGKTGMGIMRSIVAGEHDPKTLAQQRDPRCAKSEEEIAKALTGNYRAEHIFALKQAVELYDFYTNQIQACDTEIERWYTSQEAVVDVEAHPLPALGKNKRPGKNAPAYDLRSYLYQVSGVDLVAIDGLNSVLVQEIIAEIGLDMSKWPTSKHFTSWLKIAPYNDISGGKVLRRRTGKSANRAAKALRMAAQSVSRTDTALGAFFRRMRAKHGAPKAIVATARKIACIMYHMLKDKTEYVDRGAAYYEERYRQRVVKNMERKAAKLGFKLVPMAA